MDLVQWLLFIFKQSFTLIFLIQQKQDLACTILLFFLPESREDSSQFKVLRGPGFTLTGCLALMQLYISHLQSSREKFTCGGVVGCAQVK